MESREHQCDEELKAATQKVIAGYIITGAIGMALPELVGIMGKANEMSAVDIEATYYFLQALSWIPGLLGTFLAGRDTWAALTCEGLPDQETGATHLYI